MFHAVHFSIKFTHACFNPSIAYKLSELDKNTLDYTTQTSETTEYTDCISAEG